MRERPESGPALLFVCLALSSFSYRFWEFCVFFFDKMHFVDGDFVFAFSIFRFLSGDFVGFLDCRRLASSINDSAFAGHG